MGVRSEQETVDIIVGVVLALIESEGPDAVQLRRVAHRAHLSLTTIYRFFPTRDELLLTAVQRWMADNSWSRLTPPTDGERLYDVLMRILQQVFKPWELNPQALVAYHRALTAPGGERLELQAASVFAPLISAALSDEEAEYLADIRLIMTDLTFATIAKFANGHLDITEILPTLERAVLRLTANNELHAERVSALRSAAGPLDT